VFSLQCFFLSKGGC